MKPLFYVDYFKGVYLTLKYKAREHRVQTGFLGQTALFWSTADNGEKCVQIFSVYTYYALSILLVQNSLSDQELTTVIPLRMICGTCPFEARPCNKSSSTAKSILITRAGSAECHLSCGLQAFWRSLTMANFAHFTLSMLSQNRSEYLCGSYTHATLPQSNQASTLVPTLKSIRNNY